MTKPTAYLPSDLAYTNAGRREIERLFRVISFPTESISIYGEDVGAVDVIFTDAHHPVDAANAVPPKIIASNTTTDTHITAPNSKVITLRGAKNLLQDITSTAEHALGLMMAAHRNTVLAHHYAACGRWSRYNLSAPKMLSRSTLGIVGMGRLGRRVAQMSMGIFGNVVAYDPWMLKEPAQIESIKSTSPEDTFRVGVEESMNSLAKEADIVTVHIGPSFNQTGADYEALFANQFVYEFFELIGPEGVFVNTSRGALVNEAGLLKALNDRVLRAAALDVVKNEPYINPELAAYAYNWPGRLILTPHIGGSTVDAWTFTEEWVINEAFKATEKSDG